MCIKRKKKDYIYISNGIFERSKNLIMINTKITKRYLKKLERKLK